jgi:hypothetical protein
MVEHARASEVDTIADIFSRAFDAGALSPATAELILKAKLPEQDVRRVDELLQKKSEDGLSPEQETLLQDYLNVDSILTLLKSRARRTLRKSVA